MGQKWKKMHQYWTKYLSKNTAREMDEIVKIGNLKSWILSIRNCSRYLDIEKYCIGLLKISPFEVGNVEMYETIQFDTNYQWYLCEISRFEIIKAKKYCLSII